MSQPILPADLKAWTQAAVSRYGLWAGRKMGQHFLIDKNVLRDIITAAQLKPELKVLEVGGGLGVLTLALLPRVERVVVVEVDRRLVEALRKLALGSDKLIVLAGDIIKITGSNLAQALDLKRGETFVIVANLPYDITGAFLQKFLWGDLLPQSITCLVQREVAERILAKPGQMSLLSLSCQLKSRPYLIRHVPPRAFWPPPRVQSSLVRLELLSSIELEKKLDGVPMETLWRLARIGFAARRKLLINNLASALPVTKSVLNDCLTRVGLSVSVRAQELSPQHWVLLTKELKNTGI